MRPLKVVSKPVSPEHIQAAVKQAQDFILSKIRPYRLILFGSAAVGGFCDQSDLDFLIVCRDAQTLKESQNRLGPLAFKKKFPIDLVWTTREEFERKKDLGGLMMIASQDGKVLFSEGNHDE